MPLMRRKVEVATWLILDQEVSSAMPTFGVEETTKVSSCSSPLGRPYLQHAALT